LTPPLNPSQPPNPIIWVSPKPDKSDGRPANNPNFVPPIFMNPPESIDPPSNPNQPQGPLSVLTPPFFIAPLKPTYPNQDPKEPNFSDQPILIPPFFIYPPPNPKRPTKGPGQPILSPPILIYPPNKGRPENPRFPRPRNSNVPSDQPLPVVPPFSIYPPIDPNTNQFVPLDNPSKLTFPGQPIDSIRIPEPGKPLNPHFSPPIGNYTPSQSGPSIPILPPVYVYPQRGQPILSRPPFDDPTKSSYPVATPFFVYPPFKPDHSNNLNPFLNVPQDPNFPEQSTPTLPPFSIYPPGDSRNIPNGLTNPNYNIPFVPPVFAYPPRNPNQSPSFPEENIPVPLIPPFIAYPIEPSPKNNEENPDSPQPNFPQESLPVVPPIFVNNPPKSSPRLADQTTDPKASDPSIIKPPLFVYPAKDPNNPNQNIPQPNSGPIGPVLINPNPRNPAFPSNDTRDVIDIDNLLKHEKPVSWPDLDTKEPVDVWPAIIYKPNLPFLPNQPSSVPPPFMYIPVAPNDQFSNTPGYPPKIGTPSDSLNPHTNSPIQLIFPPHSPNNRPEQIPYYPVNVPPQESEATPSILNPPHIVLDNPYDKEPGQTSESNPNQPELPVFWINPPSPNDPNPGQQPIFVPPLFVNPKNPQLSNQLPNPPHSRKPILTVPFFTPQINSPNQVVRIPSVPSQPILIPPFLIYPPSTFDKSNPNQPNLLGEPYLSPPILIYPPENKSVPINPLFPRPHNSEVPLNQPLPVIPHFSLHPSPKSGADVNPKFVGQPILNFPFSNYKRPISPNFQPPLGHYPVGPDQKIPIMPPLFIYPTNDIQVPQNNKPGSPASPISTPFFLYPPFTNVQIRKPNPFANNQQNIPLAPFTIFPPTPDNQVPKVTPDVNHPKVFTPPFYASPPETISRNSFLNNFNKSFPLVPPFLLYPPKPSPNNPPHNQPPESLFPKETIPVLPPVFINNPPPASIPGIDQPTKSSDVPFKFPIFIYPARDNVAKPISPVPFDVPISPVYIKPPKNVHQPPENVINEPLNPPFVFPNDDIKHKISVPFPIEIEPVDPSKEEFEPKSYPVQPFFVPPPYIYPPFDKNPSDNPNIPGQKPQTNLNYQPWNPNRPPTQFPFTPRMNGGPYQPPSSPSNSFFPELVLDYPPFSFNSNTTPSNEQLPPIIFKYPRQSSEQSPDGRPILFPPFLINPPAMLNNGQPIANKVPIPYSGYPVLTPPFFTNPSGKEQQSDHPAYPHGQPILIPPFFIYPPFNPSTNTGSQQPRFTGRPILSPPVLIFPPENKGFSQNGPFKYPSESSIPGQPIAVIPPFTIVPTQTGRQLKFPGQPIKVFNPTGSGDILSPPFATPIGSYPDRSGDLPIPIIPPIILHTSGKRPMPPTIPKKLDGSPVYPGIATPVIPAYFLYPPFDKSTPNIPPLTFPNNPASPVLPPFIIHPNKELTVDQPGNEPIRTIPQLNVKFGPDPSQPFIPPFVIYPPRNNGKSPIVSPDNDQRYPVQPIPILPPLFVFPTYDAKSPDSQPDSLQQSPNRPLPIKPPFFSEIPVRYTKQPIDPIHADIGDDVLPLIISPSIDKNRHVPVDEEPDFPKLPWNQPQQPPIDAPEKPEDDVTESPIINATSNAYYKLLDREVNYNTD